MDRSAMEFSTTYRDPSAHSAMDNVGGDIHACLLQLAVQGGAAAQAVPALLKVPWFHTAAAAAAGQVAVGANGQLGLGGSPQRQQQQEEEESLVAAEQQAQLSGLLAVVLQQLSLSGSHPAVATHVCELSTQLLRCQQPATDSSSRCSSSSWVSVLCDTAAQLHGQGYPAARDLAVSCVQHLESLLTGSSSFRHPAAHAEQQLRLGDQVCLQLLAAFLSPLPSYAAAAAAGPKQQTHREATCPAGLRGHAAGEVRDPSTQGSQQQAAAGVSGLQPALRQRLLQCVIPQLLAGHALSKALQTNLISPLMQAAAGAAGSTAPPAPADPSYSAVCEQLLQTVCAAAAGKQGGGTSTTRSLAAGAAEGLWVSSKVSEVLVLACQLQAHLLAACRADATSCQPLFHDLLREGLLHGDLQSRHRAVHLLQACVAAGCAPKALGPEQWEGYMMLHRALEQHMLHLIQPLWDRYFDTLWQDNGSTREQQQQQQKRQAQPPGQQQQQPEAQDQSARQQLDTSNSRDLVRWCSVLVLRVSQHSNPGVKRMGIMGLLQLDQTTLRQHMQAGAWPMLQRLLLQVLPAFSDRKLVSHTAAGSASSRQAAAVAALKQQLGAFLGTCLQLLPLLDGVSIQQPQPQQQQQTGLYMQTCAVVELLQAYLEQSIAAADTGPTLLFLLQALAAGLAQAAAAATAVLQQPVGYHHQQDAASNGSSTADRGCSLGAPNKHSNQAVLQLLTRVLAHAEWLHPAYLRPALCSTVLQLVPHCLQPGVAGPAAALSLLAACSPLLNRSAAGAGSSSAGGSPLQQQEHELKLQVQQQREVFAAGGFLDWLQSALVPSNCPPGPATVHTDDTGLQDPAGNVHSTVHSSGHSSEHSSGHRGSVHSNDLVSVLLQGSSQQQHQAAFSLGMLTLDLSPQVQPSVLAALQAAAAAAMAGAVSAVSAPNAGTGEQPQQQGQLNAAAWLLAGLQAGLVAAGAAAAACSVTSSSAGNSSTGSSSQKTATAAATAAAPVYREQMAQCRDVAAMVLPALLQHHLSIQARPGSAAAGADTAWSDAITAAVSTAAASTVLQPVLQQELAGWLGSVQSWLTAAAAQAGVSLQQQLQLLTSAHVACFALPAAAGGRDMKCSQLPGDVLASCLKLLINLQPSRITSSGSTTSSSGSSSKEGSCGLSTLELTDRLLQLHAALLLQLVSAAAAAAGPWLTRDVRQQLTNRCLEDLQWSPKQALQQLLHVLLLAAPYPKQQQQQQFSGGTSGPSDRPSSRADSAATGPPAAGPAAAAAEAVARPAAGPAAAAREAAGPAAAAAAAAAAEEVEQLCVLLQQLKPLVVSSSKRFTAEEASLVAQVFLHPALFGCRELLPILTQQLIPFALVQGGAQLSVKVMSHLCHTVLGPQPQLLRQLLPHVAHMAAFSLFLSDVDQERALQQQKCDAAVLLPSRVVLCAFLVEVARSGSHPHITCDLVNRLFSIAEAPRDSPYAWLAAREASQSSGANAVKVAVWQALCLLAPYIPQQQLPEVLRRGWSCLLCSHQHANIRPLVQLFLLVVFSRQQEAVALLLLPALNAYNTSSYQVTVSVVIMGLFVVLELGPGSAQFVPLLHALLPWALHHRHAVRVPVQVMLHVTFLRHMSAIEQSLGGEATQLLQQVRRFLTDNDEMVKLRCRQGLVDLQGFDLEHETSLQGVFGVPPEQLDQLYDGETDTTGLLWHLHVRERLPLDLLRCLPGAVKAVGARRGANGASQVAAAAAAASAAGDCSAAADAGDADAGVCDGALDSTCLAGPAEQEPAGRAWHQFRPQIEGCLFDDAAAGWADVLAAERASKPGLIMCASLLENLPNLAGLCRTCESMSAEALVVPSRAVVATDAFKKQARTSERWLRLLEVGVSDLGAFLQEQREQGYTIIGVEQATNSVQLQSFSFPQRCVLVLGNEQNGMPADILPVLDVCVEIPMLGVTRSLNAHVSGALSMWQYTQQHALG